METLGRSEDGKRVVVVLSWDEVQLVLNACVQAGDRVGRQGKRQHQEHLTEWGASAIALGNSIEEAWFKSCGPDHGHQVDAPEARLVQAAVPKLRIVRAAVPKLRIVRAAVPKLRIVPDGE